MNNIDYIKLLPPTLAAILLFTSAIVYWIGMIRGRVRPVLATWLIFSFAASISFITDFRETGTHGLFSNLYNIFDCFVNITTLIFIIFNKNTRKEFNKFEKGCFAAIMVIFIGWLLSGLNVITHLSIQLIMLVGYFPTFRHLWSADKNTESVTMWSLDSLASFLGTVTPLRAGDLLPIVYGLRSALCTLTVAILALRSKYKGKGKFT